METTEKGDGKLLSTTLLNEIKDKGNNVKTVLIKKAFSKFRKEFVPAKNDVAVTFSPTDRIRERRVDGFCWKECEVIKRSTPRRYYLVIQYYELYVIDINLKAYFELVGGWGFGGTAGGLDLSGRGVRRIEAAQEAARLKSLAEAEEAGVITASAGTTAGEITAAGAIEALALGAVLFYLTTLVVGWSKGFGETKVTEGWEIIYRGYEEGMPTEETIWQRCSPIVRCTDQQSASGTDSSGATGSQDRQNNRQDNGTLKNPSDVTPSIPGTESKDQIRNNFTEIDSFFTPRPSTTLDVVSPSTDDMTNNLSLTPDRSTLLKTMQNTNIRPVSRTALLGNLDDFPL